MLPYIPYTQFTHTVGTPAANRWALIISVAVVILAVVYKLRTKAMPHTFPVLLATGSAGAFGAAYAMYATSQNRATFERENPVLPGRRFELYANLADQLTFATVMLTVAGIGLLAVGLMMLSEGQGYNVPFGWLPLAAAFVLFDTVLCNGEWAWDYRDWSSGLSSVHMAPLELHWLLWVLPFVFVALSAFSLYREIRLQRTYRELAAPAEPVAWQRGDDLLG
jgi:hypothetical protein